MATSKMWLQRTRRNGLTLIESLISVTITATAGAALFAAIGSSLGTSYSALNQTIGIGLADQMFDELASVRFPTSTDTRPASNRTRVNFDDLDDYHNWSASPLTRKDGLPLGWEPVTFMQYYEVPRPGLLVPDTSFLASLTREVTVEKIEPDNDSGWTVTNDNSDFRRVTVTIKLAMNENSPDQVIAEVTRIFSYVPLAP